MRENSIVIFTSSTSPYPPRILESFLAIHHGSISAIITAQSTGNKSSVNKIQDVMNKAGWRYAVLKLLFFGLVKIRQMFGLYPSVESLSKKYKIRHIIIESVKSKTTTELLKTLNPDILLSVLFEKIFPPEILKGAQKVSLNFHPAPLPRYAGMAPTFWVLSGGEKKTAVTLHYLDEGIDSGDIFLQEEIPIAENDSVHSLYLRCCSEGSKLLQSALEKINRGEMPGTKQTVADRTYFTAPTKSGYHSLMKNGHSLFTLREFLFP